MGYPYQPGPDRAPSMSALTKRSNLVVITATICIILFFLTFRNIDIEAIPYVSNYRGRAGEVARSGKHASSLVSDEDTEKAVGNLYSQPPKTSFTTTIVLGRLKKNTEQTKWVDMLNGITHKAIYVVDDPNHPLHLERNHGREARVYLEYIINNYNKLDDITLFWHSDRYVWHNNILLKSDSVLSINQMNRTRIMEEGYVPSRCDHWPGCPSWITFNPSTAEHALDPHRVNDMFNPNVFGKIFPNVTEFPPYFAQTCCSQFAASRDAIRAVPLDEYKRLLEWIITFWADQYTGMAMEMMWQFIFKRKGRLCPSMQECYCKTYGVCIEDPVDLELLDTWNQYRTRSDELEWQQHFVATQWEEKQRQIEQGGGERRGHAEDEPEYRRIREDKQASRRGVARIYDILKKKYDLPDALVQW